MIIKDEIKNKKNIKLLIFDIDGTLVKFNNLESLVKEAYDFFCIVPTKEDIVGQSLGVKELLLRSETEKVFSLTKMSEYWDKYMNLSTNKIHPIDFTCKMLNLEIDYLEKIYGVKETINYLNDLKRMVCSTNWFLTSQRKKLIYAGVNENIERVYTCEMEYSKPSKYHFIRILDDQGLLSDDVLMIGDSNADLACKNIGIQSVLVDYNKEKQELYSNASSVITEFQDLIKILKI